MRKEGKKNLKNRRLTFLPNIPSMYRQPYFKIVFRIPNDNEILLNVYLFVALT